MTLGCLAAGGSLAGRLITPSVMAQLVLTELTLALVGDELIDRWAIDFTCSEEQVVGSRAVRAGPSV